MNFFATFIPNLNQEGPRVSLRFCLSCSWVVIIDSSWTLSAYYVPYTMEGILYRLSLNLHSYSMKAYRLWGNGLCTGVLNPDHLSPGALNELLGKYLLYPHIAF